MTIEQLDLIAADYSLANNHKPVMITDAKNAFLHASPAEIESVVRTLAGKDDEHGRE